MDRFGGGPGVSAGHVIEKLAEDYPLLYLDPDRDDRDAYRRVVLHGRDPERRTLAHYRGGSGDRDEIGRAHV